MSKFLTEQLIACRTVVVYEMETASALLGVIRACGITRGWWLLAWV
jgi:hypothetical protein